MACPFKRMYSPDFFSNLALLIVMYRPLKNYSEKMGSPCLFLACEHALQGTLAAALQKEGELATTSFFGI